MRDIQGDYRAAYIAEYEAYTTAGRDEDAAVVAQILRDHYAHEVEADQHPQQERADADKPPENSAEPKPRRSPRTKPSQGDGK